MVSKMETETNSESGDQHLQHQQQRIISQSAVSQRSIDLQILPSTDDNFNNNNNIINNNINNNNNNNNNDNNPEQINPPSTAIDDITKKTLTLGLITNKNCVIEKTSSIDSDKYIENINNNNNMKSPKSPSSHTNRTVAGGTTTIRTMPHQPSSITSQIDVVEDRKALRDALYQGIFHRHRRTIFAVGSFLRMFRTRNSQYNTIRSTSEGDDDTR